MMHQATVFRRAAILMALLAALAAIASSSAAHEALLNALLLTNEVIDKHVIVGAVVFILLAAVSAMVAFISIALVVPAAVFAWGTPMTAGLLWLGWILGGVATYSIGRFLGRPVVSWLAADAALRKVESRLPADASLSLIVLLQLALPSEIPGYVLGLLRYPFARYAAALAIAELPYAFATVYLGASFVAGRGGLILLIGIVITLVSLAALSCLHRAMRTDKCGDTRSSADLLSVTLP